jgi:hypothetical protein
VAKRKLTRANYEAIRDHLFDRIHRNGEELKNDFPNILRTAIETEAWKHFTDGDGKPFKNLVDWLHYTFPNGAGMGQGQHAITYEEALKLTEGAADVHRVLAQNAPNRGREGDRKSKAARENQNYVRSFDFPRGSMAKPVLAARLAQEHPKVYEAYLRGDYRSIRAAAEAAGLVNPGNEPLNRLKSNWRKATKREREAFLEWLESEEAKRTKETKGKNGTA